MNRPRPAPPRTSLGHRLLAINTLTNLIAVAVVSVVMTVGEYVGTRHAMEKDLEVTAGLLAANTSASLLFRAPGDAEELLGGLKGAPTVVSAELTHANGALFAAYRRPAALGESAPPEGETGFLAPLLYVEAVQPVLAEGNVLGNIRLRADLQPLYARLMLYMALNTAGLGLALLVAHLLLRRLQQRITAPLSELATVAQAVASSRDYSRRVPEGGDEEIASFARSFNAMLVQIQTRDGALEQELAERRRAEESLDRLAHYDPVTGLPNRHFFNKHLADKIVRGASLGECSALILLDLDNFKIVNDNFGHHAGDRLLSTIADRFRHIMRAADVVCRIGGDEFALVVGPLTDRRQAERVADKLITALAEPVDFEGSQIYATASVGISLWPDDAVDAHGLMVCADTALYSAKELGKNNCQIFVAAMKDKVQRRMALETGLRRALTTDWNEFVLLYQPQLDLESGKVIGVEALLRWQHPDVGTVSPAHFIPVAEETGLIIPLGEWVLRTACRQARQWLDEGLALRIAVNLSPRQLREGDMAGKVAAILQETGLPAQRLELELTEGILMDSSENLSTILAEIDHQGVRLAVDDFGTGYSSMRYLKHFPITQLKIDQSFVKNLPSSGEDAAICKAIVALAEALQMEVIAEGVETAEQLRFCRDAGCDLLQGYFISRPLPPQAVGKFCRRIGDASGPFAPKAAPVNAAGRNSP